MFRVVVMSCFAPIILLFTVSARAEVVTIGGTIKSVDAKKRTITIEADSKTQTLDVSSKAMISVEGKKGTLDSLKTGQEVKLSYHKDLEIVLKIEVGPSDSSVATGRTLSLFDGRTLKGWRGNPKHWKVVDGAIVGKVDRPTGGSFLSHEKPFGDFELRLKFNLVRGNSGIQIRSKQHRNYIVSGHQVDIVYKNFRLLGCLVGEGIRGGAEIAMTDEAIQEMLRRSVKEDDWNAMTIVAKGSSVRIDVNGITTVDADVPNIPTTGIIAFQLHWRDPTEVMFKDITLRRLDSR